MPARVTLKITKGKLEGQEFVFDERTTSIIGKLDDCGLRLPKDQDHKTISRCWISTRQTSVFATLAV